MATLLILVLICALLSRWSGIGIRIGKRKMTSAQRSLFTVLFLFTGIFALLYLLEIKFSDPNQQALQRRRSSQAKYSNRR